MTEHAIGNCGQHRSPHSIAQDVIEWGILGCLGHPPFDLLYWLRLSGHGQPLSACHSKYDVSGSRLDLPKGLGAFHAGDDAEVCKSGNSGSAGGS